MSTWTLIIMLLGNMSGTSGGMTSVTGFSSRDVCQTQATQLQQVQVDRGARRIQTMCVEVK
jgi:hypothetical protein